MTTTPTNHVFGPVRSRRLGRSLGIDPVPSKTCNWNCVYCQLGRTCPLTNRRRRYRDRGEILAQVRSALDAGNRIDWVTFVGSGEPTLHSELGKMIRDVQALTRLPVAVITNGALLERTDVRRELAAADAVLPSLDAGSPDLYRRLNRPHRELPYGGVLDGLVRFRTMFTGRLWVEVMLIRGANDTEPALIDLARALQRVKADEVHLSLPLRPPAESWVRPADAEGLMRATAILGSTARVLRPVDNDLETLSRDRPVDDLERILVRHPMAEERLRSLLHRTRPEQADGILRQLAERDRVRKVTRHGRRFWTASRGRYAAPAAQS